MKQNLNLIYSYEYQLFNIITKKFVKPKFNLKKEYFMCTNL